MKQNDDLLRAQINALIRDEIQENINDYVDSQEETKKSGLGFVGKDEDGELKVNIPVSEVDKILKEYKKLKRKERSAFGQIKKLGLVDKTGQPLENKKEEDVKDNKKGITGTQTFKN
tara:strand:+ start:231 stop:581 length:351 start_codon:yes stop_codon:yes gene_type:complete